MHRFLAIAAACIVISSTNPTAQTAARPLLHLDLVVDSQGPNLVTVATSLDGKRVATFEAGEAVWSPDGSQFAALANTGRQDRVALKVFRIDSPQGTRLFDPGNGEMLTGWAPAWAPDGKTIAVTVMKESSKRENGVEYSVVIVDVAGKSVRARHVIPEGVLNLPRHLSPADKIRFSSGGKHLLLSWERAAVLDLDRRRWITISEWPIIADWAAGPDAVIYLDLVPGASARRPVFGGLYLRKLASDDRVELANTKTLAAHGIAVHSALHSGLMVVSPSRTKVALVHDLADKNTAALRVFEMAADGTIDLSRPVRTQALEEIVAKLEWSIDERSIAVAAIPATAVLRQGPFGKPAFKILTLPDGGWETVATMNFDLRQDWPQSLELIGLAKLLSWTGGS
jgi:hypothetical protein